MNLLLDVLPEYVTIDGEQFFVDTNFRTFIIFEIIMLDNKIGAREKVNELLGLCYTDKMPADKESALNELLMLYRCGEALRKSEPRKNGNVVLKPKHIYDFRIDASYIYGAFLSQYGIDLNEIEYLHWWKFMAMFKSLNSSNKIVEIMGYRAADLSKIESKSERNRIAKLQQTYALPQNLSTEDKVAIAGAAFGGGF